MVPCTGSEAAAEEEAGAGVAAGAGAGVAAGAAAVVATAKGLESDSSHKVHEAASVLRGAMYSSSSLHESESMTHLMFP